MIDTDVIVGDAWSRGLDVPRWHRGNLDPLRKYYIRTVGRTREWIPPSQLLDWRSMLTVVKPDTLIGWHRQGWRLFWRWKSRSGRPPIPVGLRRLIVANGTGEPDLGRGADRG